MGNAALQNLKINDQSFLVACTFRGKIANNDDTNNDSSSNVEGWSSVPGPKASASHSRHSHGNLIREVSVTI